MFILKKDGRKEKWQPYKIFDAVAKSADRVNIKLSGDFYSRLSSLVYSKLKSEIDVKNLHKIVENSIQELGENIVAESYRSFRNYKTNFVDMMAEIYSKANTALKYGDRENANFESTLISTKQALIRGYLTKELYKTNYLTTEELNAIDEGYIYIHDLRDLIFNGFNCCLFDMATVLEGGFEMANLKYKEPSNVLSCLQVIGDVTLSASAQQFGGFTLPEIDKVLVKYIKKSIVNYGKEAVKYGVQNSYTYAMEKTQNDLEQGFQSLEMKLNSVTSSRGDYSFVTLTFGNLDIPEDRQYQLMACKAILKNRKKDNPVVFPKLVHLFSWEQYEGVPETKELFDLSIDCSCKALYPDYLAIDTVGKVAEYYKSSGKVVSPMGCRAYLSDFYDENGEMFFAGRANTGAVSLNLPMIYMKAKEEGVDFYKTLDYYLEMIRNFHKRRYIAVSENKASTNPLCFTQGGLYGGTLKPDDKIGSIVKGFTASFGITALNELNVLYENQMLHKSNKNFINTVVDYIDNRVNDFKKEDGWLYALYATPAESLCGTQREQFVKKYGIIENVSDKLYFSNGFHCHVSAEISPFEKQDQEFELFHKINGGHIQYTRVDTTKPNVVKGIVLRGMSMGFYSGINANKSFCEDCGWSPEKDMDVVCCENCGSHNILEINRLCGYLGYSKQKQSTRFNDAKIEELKDRKSM